MALGTDASVCTEELVAAMRARLEAEAKGLGANVDLEAVRANLAALGTAVFRVATVRADTSSDATADAAFWAWTGRVNDYMTAVQAWHSAFVTAVQAWMPTTAPEVQFKSKLVALPAPPAPPAAPPSSLKGKIR